MERSSMPYGETALSTQEAYPGPESMALVRVALWLVFWLGPQRYRIQSRFSIRGKLLSSTPTAHSAFFSPTTLPPPPPFQPAPAVQ